MFINFCTGSSNFKNQPVLYVQNLIPSGGQGLEFVDTGQVGLADDWSASLSLHCRLRAALSKTHCFWPWRLMALDRVIWLLSLEPKVYDYMFLKFYITWLYWTHGVGKRLLWWHDEYNNLKGIKRTEVTRVEVLNFENIC